MNVPQTSKVSVLFGVLRFTFVSLTSNSEYKRLLHVDIASSPRRARNILYVAIKFVVFGYNIVCDIYYLKMLYDT